MRSPCKYPETAGLRLVSKGAANGIGFAALGLAQRAWQSGWRAWVCRGGGRRKEAPIARTS